MNHIPLHKLIPPSTDLKDPNNYTTRVSPSRRTSHLNAPQGLLKHKDDLLPVSTDKAITKRNRHQNNLPPNYTNTD